MLKKIGLVFAAVAGLGSNGSNADQPPTPAATPTQLERLLSEVRVGQRDVSEVWPVFVNTSFFVPIHKLDEKPDKTSDFAFVLFPSTKTPGRKTVIVSERLESLQNKASDNAIRMKGGELVQLVNPEVEITVALPDGAFGIPVEVAKWLRESIQVEKR